MSAAPPQLFHEPLSPISFLERSAAVHGEAPAVVHEDRRLTYAELRTRALGLAGALRRDGLGEGARVAVLAPNVPVLLEAHYGVPMAGSVLVALNVRLAAPELAYILEHSGARALIYDAQFSAVARQAAGSLRAPLRLVRAGGRADEYERWLDGGAGSPAVPVADEMALLALNYTSGTTGRPKGVMYHHRGAYLQSLAMALHARLAPGSVFLWTLPMFHCNGWCFTWAATAAGSTHVCLRTIDPESIWRLVREAGITHFNAAPTVLSSLAHHPAADEGPAPRPVHVCTGGAPPSPALLERLAALGIEVTHLYGLTETFGPAVVCDWKPAWSARPKDEQARLKARQGVGNVVSQHPRVIDAEGRDVPRDGQTMGEVALRGNNVMLGYYRDPVATAQAAPNGWFRTGDLGVMHPDGYVELRDRAKDVIVSGGENISSVEVEQAIASHPAVLEAAVVPAPDERWGERPVAFVTLKGGVEADPESIRDHVRTRLARFKAPDRVEYRDQLPRTATGKVQKYLLREELWAGTGRRTTPVSGPARESP